MVIALACDHGAFDLKEAMKTYLEENSGTISLFLNDFLKPELMC